MLCVHVCQHLFSTLRYVNSFSTIRLRLYLDYYLLQTTHHFLRVCLWESQHSWTLLLASVFLQSCYYWRVLLTTHSEGGSTLMQWKDLTMNLNFLLWTQKSFKTESTRKLNNFTCIVILSAQKPSTKIILSMLHSCLHFSMAKGFINHL